MHPGWHGVHMYRTTSKQHMYKSQRLLFQLDPAPTLRCTAQRTWRRQLDEDGKLSTARRRQMGRRCVSMVTSNIKTMHGGRDPTGLNLRSPSMAAGGRSLRLPRLSQYHQNYSLTNLKMFNKDSYVLAPRPGHVGRMGALRHRKACDERPLPEETVCTVWVVIATQLAPAILR